MLNLKITLPRKIRIDSAGNFNTVYKVYKLRNRSLLYINESFCNCIELRSTKTEDGMLQDGELKFLPITRMMWMFFPIWNSCKFGFFTNIQKLCIPRYLQFPYLCAPYCIGKCKIRCQWAVRGLCFKVADITAPVAFQWYS